MEIYFIILMWSGLLVTAACLYLSVGCFLLCLYDVKLGISNTFNPKSVPLMMFVMAIWPLVLGYHLLNHKELDDRGESPDSGRV